MIGGVEDRRESWGTYALWQCGFGKIGSLGRVQVEAAIQSLSIWNRRLTTLNSVLSAQFYRDLSETLPVRETP